MVWFIRLILLLLPSYLIRFSVLGIPTTVFEVLIYIAVLALLFTRPWARIGERLKPFLKQFGWPILLLLIGAIIGAVIAPDKRLALGLLKAYLVDPLLLGAILLIVLDSRTKLQQGLIALIAGGVLVALSAILGPRNVEGRALGLYAFEPMASPNFAGLFLAPFFVMLPIWDWGRNRLLSKMALISILLALVLIQSRGAFFGIGLGIGVTILLHRFKKSAKFLLIPLFIILAVIAGVWLSRPDFSSTASRRATTSNNLHYEIWRTTIVDIIPANWLFGVGLGNYQNYFSDLTKTRVNFPEYISPWARTPHNIFLTIWLNFGLLGLVGLIALLWRFYQLTDALVPKIAMLTLLGHGLFDAAYWKNDLAALFWILIVFGWLYHESRKVGNHGTA